MQIHKNNLLLKHLLTKMITILMKQHSIVLILWLNSVSSCVKKIAPPQLAIWNNGE